MRSTFARIQRILASAVLMSVLYMLWGGTDSIANIVIMSLVALLVASITVKNNYKYSLHPKQIIYALMYIAYLFLEIIKSNLDVASRVVKIKIPINPGIVKVKTKLKSKLGRMILANSITLTPGTITVDVKDDIFYIHWIDVKDTDIQKASNDIVAGFEKYLEVIFG